MPVPHLNAEPAQLFAEAIRMTDPHGKAYKDGYNPPAFCYMDTSLDFARIVAWTGDVQQMSNLVWELLQTFSEEVDVLLKIRRLEPDPIDGPYRRFNSVVPLANLLEVVGRHYTYVFQSSRHVLCIRKVERDEYLALDEFGTLFYYTNSEKLLPVFERCGFVNEKHPFIDTGGCYLQSWDQEEEWQVSFINELQMDEVHYEPGPDVEPV